MEERRNRNSRRCLLWRRRYGPGATAHASAGGFSRTVSLLTDPRILVLGAEDARIDTLCHGLDVLGWRTVTARGVEAALAALADWPIEAVLIHAVDDRAAEDAERLRAAARPRRLPVVACGEALAADDRFDLVLSMALHPAQAALRFEQMIRAAVAEEEVELRAATFAAAGSPLPQEGDGDARPLNVLAAGRPDHRFLALSNALTALGCEVTAAPTPYTAFDYLHERAFDAAVLWGGEDHAPAQSIAAGMKRNTRLYHVPVTLYLSHAVELDMANLYGRGFADVAAAETPEGETARRVVALARTHRRHQAFRRRLEAARHSGVTDPATGLFTPELFAAHLARLAQAARARRRPLSVCVLKLSENEAIHALKADGWLARALPQLGAMVSRLIRVEDTAARLSDGLFALALPATSEAQARIAAERIGAVIGCTAFDAGPERPPFVAGFDIGAAEARPGETPAALLERASAALRPAIA